MKPTSALIALIVISVAFIADAGGRNRGKFKGGVFSDRLTDEEKQNLCNSNSIVCSTDGSDTCPDESMKPALTLEEQEQWQICFCCVDMEESKEEEKQVRCEDTGITCDPADRVLSGNKRNRGGNGYRGDKGKNGPFQTKEELVDIAQKYCCGY